MNHAFTFDAALHASGPDGPFKPWCRNRRWADGLARASATGVGAAWLIACALPLPCAAQSAETQSPRAPTVTGAPFQQIEDLCLREKKDRIKVEEEEIKKKLTERKKPYDPEQPHNRIKTIRYEICDNWVRHYYTQPQEADQLIALRDSVDRQKDAARDGFAGRYFWLQIHQWAVVVLGMLATILTARASRPKPANDGKAGGAASNWTFSSAVAVLLTATVTALGSMAVFYDLRGAVERNAKVLVTMGELQSRIDDQLMANLLPQAPEKPAEPPTVPGRIRQWSLERDKVLKTASDEWTKAVTSTGR